MMGDKEQALSSAFGAVDADKEDPCAWLVLGNLLLAKRRAMEASRCFATSADLEPNTSHVLLRLAYAKLVTRQYEDAVETCLRAIDLDPADPDAWNMLSYSYAKLRLGEHAIDAGREAVRRRADRHSWDTLGSAYSTAGRPRQAIQCFLRAISLDWNHGVAWFNLGREYHVSGDSDKAASVLTVIRRIDLAWAGALINEIERVNRET